ncbi:MAG TPA: response regulator, partial [Verrucomicrobiae bacterium]
MHTLKLQSLVATGSTQIGFSLAHTGVLSGSGQSDERNLMFTQSRFNGTVLEGGSTMRLLIVEDEKKLADSVALGLRAERFAVDVAYDGREGRSMAGQHQYDLLIVDLMLPGMGGTDLLRSVRETDSNVPILILTALSGTAEKVKNFDAGADDYLTKPFAFAELLVRV